MDNLGNKLLEIHPKRKVFKGFKIKTDRETGLPELPEGFYWFVSKSGWDGIFSGVRVHVRLYDESGSELVTSSQIVFSEDGDTVPETILFLTRYILRIELQEAHDKQYFGKYPPKKLEK